MLEQLVYLSAATHELDDAALSEILEESRRNNATRDVTGVLLYGKGGFLQVLEGDRQALEETYARIKRDPRHHSLILAQRGAIEVRDFGDWSMAFEPLDPEVAAKLEKFHDLRGAEDHRLTGGGRMPAMRALVMSFVEGLRERQLSLRY